MRDVTAAQIEKLRVAGLAVDATHQLEFHFVGTPDRVVSMLPHLQSLVRTVASETDITALRDSTDVQLNFRVGLPLEANILSEQEDMLEKLAGKLGATYTGWDVPTARELLRAHDVANEKMVLEDLRRRARELSFRVRAMPKMHVPAKPKRPPGAPWPRAFNRGFRAAVSQPKSRPSPPARESRPCSPWECAHAAFEGAAGTDAARRSMMASRFTSGCEPLHLRL